MPDKVFCMLPDLPQSCAISAEFQLLAACSWLAPPAFEQVQGDRIVSLCNHDIDWDAFLGLVRWHGVAEQAALSLQKSGVAKLPEALRDGLKKLRFTSSIKAMQHGAELIRLQRLFSVAGIEALPLKGVLLSLRLYGNQTTRTSSDIDMMVKEVDFDAVDRILAAAGYTNVYPGLEMTAKQRAFAQKHIHHFEYVHRSSGIRLELHIRSFLWDEEQTAYLWKNCGHTEWIGERFVCLQTDAQLLYLCEHGARHGWFRLKWLSDIAMLLALESDKDWESLLASADRLGLNRVLAHAMLMVHWLYGLQIPAALRALVLKDPESHGLSLATLNALLAQEKIGQYPAKRHFNRLRECRQMIRLRPTLSLRRVITEVMIAPEDFVAVPLPDWLFWLYLPMRPFFWLWRNHLGHWLHKTT